MITLDRAIFSLGALRMGTADRSLPTVNPLSRWLEANGGSGAKRRLAEASGLRWQSIHLIALDRQIPTPETIVALERGTLALGAPLPADDLVRWFAEHPRPQRTVTTDSEPSTGAPLSRGAA